jgi:phage baseplate assembly protein W
MKGLSPKLPVQRDATDGYALTKTHTEMVLQNLKNLLLTVPGEKMMDPLFGVGLKKFLFEQHSIATYSNIHTKLLSQVNRYMPFLTIDDMVFYGPEGIWSAVKGVIPSRDLSVADLNNLQIRIFLTIIPLAKETTLDLSV